ncbi:hypothetical protein Barb4_00864 [Bacteroidales bacterium Barb4]|nr:hypothetical protein Barb4_00864 [Bacteroidales bacterium Barb4]
MFDTATGEVEEGLPDDGVDKVEDLLKSSAQGGILRRQLVVEPSGVQGFGEGVESTVGLFAGIAHGAFQPLSLLFFRPCEVQFRESRILRGKVGDVCREGERCDSGGGIRLSKVFQQVDDTPRLVGVGSFFRPFVVVEDILQVGRGFLYVGINTADCRRYRHRDAHQRVVPRFICLLNSPRLLRLLVALVNMVFFGKSGIVLGKKVGNGSH